MTRTDVLNALIEKYKYLRYLEIGLGDLENFKAVQCLSKIGVDPQVTVSANNLMRVTSDVFFVEWEHHKGMNFDLIFIDGLHDKSQVAKDVANSLQVLREGGTVVLHDVLPTQAEQATEQINLTAGGWCGTVWQAWLCLRVLRSDLSMKVLDCDHGVGIIRRGNQQCLNLPFELFEKHKQDWLNVVPATEAEL